MAGPLNPKCVRRMGPRCDKRVPTSETLTGSTEMPRTWESGEEEAEKAKSAGRGEIRVWPSALAISYPAGSLPVARKTERAVRVGDPSTLI